MTDRAGQFDLRQQPWIGVIDHDGRPRELGIRDVLVEAHELAAIVDASPLVEVALHRLLIAILHRVTAGPNSPEAWVQLWQLGQFAAAAIDAYLDPLAERFDLFGAERPFYQVRGLVAAGVRPRPIGRLTHELASEGNSAFLFDHTVRASFTPARAARALVALQTFALGGLTTPPPGSTDRSSVDAPPARAAIFLIRGRSLFETLLSNLVRYDPAAGVPVAGEGLDLPAWERPAAAIGSTRQPTGYLDILTWQARRIELSEPDADGAVTGAAMVSGDRVAAGRELAAIEPTMLAYAPGRVGTSDAAAQAVRLSTKRHLWRDSTALLTAAGQPEGQRPEVLEWLAGLVFAGHTHLAAALLPLHAAGLVAYQAKTLLWRREGLALPVAALRDPAVAERVRAALASAERVGTMLGDGDLDRDAVGRPLPRPLAQIAKALLEAPGGRPRPASVLAFISSTQAADRYWAALATPFAVFVHDLAGASQGADPDAGYAAAGTAWEAAIRDAGRDAFTRATSALAATPRALFALAAAERAFRGGLARAVPQDPTQPDQSQEVVST